MKNHTVAYTVNRSSRQEALAGSMNGDILVINDFLVPFAASGSCIQLSWRNTRIESTNAVMKNQSAARIVNTGSKQEMPVGIMNNRGITLKSNY